MSYRIPSPPPLPSHFFFCFFFLIGTFAGHAVYLLFHFFYTQSPQRDKILVQKASVQSTSLNVFSRKPTIWLNFAHFGTSVICRSGSRSKGSIIRGIIWKSTHFDMASAALPTCFSRDEIAFSCVASLRNANGKCLGRRTWNRHSFIKMKLWSSTCDSRIIQLTSSYRNCSQLKSRASHLVVHGKKNIASEGDIHTGPQANKVDLPNAILVHVMSQWRQMQVMTVAGVLACAFFVIPSADATDALKTCSCLLKECRVELAKCIANPSCAANVACLQTCNNRPDETECQIKCGDLFENSVVDEFNECAVSRKKCVPTKSDLGEFPVPDPAALVKSFNIGDFNGKWYISSGLNPTFDTFDCQLHEFHTESNKLVGNLTWRIRTPDTGFFTRTATQKFVQDPMQPGILYNHDNEYLHYQDDWYILSSKIENKPDDYVFVYYRGKNDAWDGYGGAFLYTRSSVVPESIVPELERAAKSVGRDFNTFIRTDNTCGPEPPLVERLEKTVEEGERTIIREVEQIEEEVEKVEKTELNLLQKLLDGFNEIKKDEENFLKGLTEEEMEILNDLKMEANELEKLFGQALPLRKLK